MYLACNLGKICSLRLSIHLSLRITVFFARFLIRRFAATAASRDAWTLVLLHTKELVCLPRLSLTGSQQSSRGNNCCPARSKHEVPTRNFAAWMTPSPWQDCDNATCTLRVEAVLRLYLRTVLVSIGTKKWKKKWPRRSRQLCVFYIKHAVIILAFCRKGRILTIIFHLFVCF